MRLVLLGDGESPHLEKWARALAPRVELWAASSRGFTPGLEALLPAARRLALGTTPRAEGGNVAVLRTLPRLAAWLRTVRADWIHAHYLSSHGTLAWLATRVLGVPGRIAGSAWGSDILVAPQRSRVARALTRRVLRACAITTSDSQVMADRMRELGAREVMVFPFGLESLPPAATQAKDDALFFANRGLEAIYRPQRVLEMRHHLGAQGARGVFLLEEERSRHDGVRFDGDDAAFAACGKALRALGDAGGGEVVGDNKGRARCHPVDDPTVVGAPPAQRELVAQSHRLRALGEFARIVQDERMDAVVGVLVGGVEPLMHDKWQATTVGLAGCEAERPVLLEAVRGLHPVEHVLARIAGRTGVHAPRAQGELIGDEA